MTGNALIGLVCCGGKSSRMGQDKGLLMNHGQTWAAHMASLVEQAGWDYRISIRSDQQEAYRKHFSAERLLEDDIHLNIKGPALGILSAHQQLPGHPLLVLACDLQQLQPDRLRELVAVYQDHPEAGAIVVEHGEGLEPMCAIYTPTALARISRLAVEGRLERNSLKYLLNWLRVKTIPLAAEHRQQLKNFNYPEDLAVE